MRNKPIQWMGVLLLAVRVTCSGQAAPAPGFSFSAPKQIFTTAGARLEGTAAQPAHIHNVSPLMDVTALSIALGFQKGQIQQVTARQQVHLKLDLAGQKGGPPAHINVSCDNATLTPATRTLVLRGGVDGFYEPEGGARISLSGSQATLQYLGTDLTTDIEGGTAPAQFMIPAEAMGNLDTVGSVTITAHRVKVDSAANTASFSGGARAVSTDGASPFDIAAPEFVLTRTAKGAVDTLKSIGRTFVKVDFPPEAPRPVAVVKTDTPVGAAAVKQLSRPTHVEVAADSATVTRATSRLSLDGDVRGFYTLAPPDTAPQNYNFSGDHVVMRFVSAAEVTQTTPAGLNVEITGRPVEVTAPNLTLEMGK